MVYDQIHDNSKTTACQVNKPINTPTRTVFFLFVSMSIIQSPHKIPIQITSQSKTI
jgi:hypothetical protein